MADMLGELLVGMEKMYECKPEDLNQAPAKVDMSSPIVWSLAPAGLATLTPDPAGNALRTNIRRDADGEITVSCEMDADRGVGTVSLVINAIIPDSATSASAGHIVEVTP